MTLETDRLILRLWREDGMYCSMEEARERQRYR
jgi:hypothetical protein